MNSKDAIEIGERLEWGNSRPFSFSTSDRRQHIYCVGKTGTGKTTLLLNMLVQDIVAGRGVALWDPHGDISRQLLDLIPPSRADDVVYFDPANEERCIGFNLIQSVPRKNRHLVASGVVEAFKNLYADSWGPRLEYILYASVAALLDCENTTLLGIQKLLVDSRYRRWVVKQIKDPAVRSFWINEFERWDVKFRTEAISPILNKIGQILMSPPMRNVLGQVRRKIDFRFMMDHKRIFIANLSKGALGTDKANLIGSLLVTAFQQAAMSRMDTPEEMRVDFFAYIDEFQNFSTESFVSILSEARKYKFCLTLAHQFTEQLSPQIREAIFGNVGTIMAFRVGNTDALRLAQEFGSPNATAQFTDLKNFQVCVKLLEHGRSLTPFLGTTLPPIGKLYGRGENISSHSQQKYGITKTIIEEKLNRWMNQ